MSKASSPKTVEGKETVIIVHWYGPFNKEQAKKISDSGILYLVTGGTKREPTQKFRYCGITNLRFQHRIQNHPTLKKIEINRQVWIGWLQYPHPLRPRRAHMEAAESLIVHYWGTLLNCRKASSPSKSNLTLISHWFSHKGTPCKHKPQHFHGLPDVISWNADKKMGKTGDFSRKYSDY